MSDLLQPAQHPDADQLSAFAEHALPAHEQADVLAHLAVCPDCRAVVFIALPPEPIPEPQPAPALTSQPASSRRRWYSGWNLAWPVAAAFAVLLLTVALRHQIKPHSSTTSQIAETSDPPSPPISPALAPPAATVPVKPAPKRAPAMPEPPSVKPGPPPSVTVSMAQSVGQVPPQPAGQAAQQRTLTYQDVQDLALQGRDTTELLKVLPGVVTMAQGSTTDAAHGSTGIPAPAPGAAPSTMAYAAQLSVDPEANASSTVITGAALNALSASPEVLRVQSLPSHLAAVSVATAGTRMLALDTARTLFLSDDHGQHWKVVRPAWEGRAARVALVSQTLAAAPAAAPALRGRAAFAAPVAETAASTASAPAPAAAAPPPAPLASSLSGTVTDPAGASISGATVTLTNVATSASTTLTTDHSGRYAANLPAGAYRIQISAMGFAPSQLTTTLAAARPSVDNFTLAIGATTDTVTVTSVAGQILQTEQAQPSTTMLEATGPNGPAPVFSITTDSGTRWTSPDGEHWTRQ